MSAFYSYLPNSNRFEYLTMNFPDKVLIGFLNSKPLLSKWKPFKVQIEGNRDRQSDFPSYNVPIFSERAYNVLRKLLEESGCEALPVNHPRGTFYLIHTLGAVDVLDHKKSEIDYDPEDKEIFVIMKHVFNSRKIKNRHFFQIPEHTAKHIMSDRFVQLIKKEKLEGLAITSLD